MQSTNLVTAGAAPRRPDHEAEERELEARADLLKQRRTQLLAELRATSGDLRANSRALASVVKKLRRSREAGGRRGREVL